jgi:hypothetical protein
MKAAQAPVFCRAALGSVSSWCDLPVSKNFACGCGIYKEVECLSPLARRMAGIKEMPELAIAG